MSKRICPSCQKKLGSYDHYFCTRCGTQLPNELAVPGKSIVRVMTVEEPEKPHVDFKEHIMPVIDRVVHIINLKEILMILLLAFVIGVPVYYWLTNFSTYINSPSDNNLTEQESVKKDLIVESDIDLKSHIFGSSNIWEYVPYDAEAYVEGHDIQKAAELYSDFDEGYAPVFKKLVPVVDPHFGAYLKEYDGQQVWVLLVFPYESQIDDEGLDLSEFEWLKTGRVDDVLVLSPADALQDVKDSKASIKKNLGDNPQFKIYIEELPLSGKLMFISLSDKARSYLIDKSGMQMPEDMSEILDSYLQTKYDDIVFK